MEWRTWTRRRRRRRRRQRQRRRFRCKMTSTAGESSRRRRRERRKSKTHIHYSYCKSDSDVSNNANKPRRVCCETNTDAARRGAARRGVDIMSLSTMRRPGNRYDPYGKGWDRRTGQRAVDIGRREAFEPRSALSASSALLRCYEVATSFEIRLSNERGG